MQEQEQCDWGKAAATDVNYPIVPESSPEALERGPGHLPGPWLPGLLSVMGGRRGKDLRET